MDIVWTISFWKTLKKYAYKFNTIWYLLISKITKTLKEIKLYEVNVDFKKPP